MTNKTRVHGGNALPQHTATSTARYISNCRRISGSLIVARTRVAVFYFTSFAFSSSSASATRLTSVEKWPISSCGPPCPCCLSLAISFLCQLRGGVCCDVKVLGDRRTTVAIHFYIPVSNYYHSFKPYVTYTAPPPPYVYQN